MILRKQNIQICRFLLLRFFYNDISHSQHRPARFSIFNFSEFNNFISKDHHSQINNVTTDNVRGAFSRLPCKHLKLAIVNVDMLSVKHSALNSYLTGHFYPRLLKTRLILHLLSNVFGNTRGKDVLIYNYLICCFICAEFIISNAYSQYTATLWQKQSQNLKSIESRKY